MKKKNIKIAGISFILFLILILAFATLKNERGGNGSEEQTIQSEGKKYVCSMHPQVIRDAPGDCPICGMFLIELIEQDGNSYDSSMTDIVRPVNESVLGYVKNVTPEYDTMPIVIEAPGIINYDPRKIRTVSAHFGGYIERTYVKFQFQHIKKGQEIFKIHSPDIYTDHWNYVKLIQAYPDRDDLTSEALEWFNLLGLSKGQVDSLKHAVRPDYHLAVYSGEEGYAVSRDFDPETFFINGFSQGNDPAVFLAASGNLGFNEGVTVETGDQLFKLIDINALRVDLKVKTEYGPLLEKGQQVIFTDAAFPQRKFKAYIGQIEPLNGGLFQTVKVFFRDKERLLLPGRQIEAQIITGQHEGLWIPATSVAVLGQHNTVFVWKDNNYIATEVWTGIKTNSKIEILYGINKNSLVAEKAFLLVDSDGFVSPE